MSCQERLREHLAVGLSQRKALKDIANFNYHRHTTMTDCVSASEQ